MDRNSIVGLLLIGALIIGYSIFNQPNKAEIETMKRKQDSIALVTHETERKQAAATPLVPVQEDTLLNDSAKQALAEQQLGVFASSAKGADEKYVLENNLIKVTVSAKGGRIQAVELKNYKTFDG